MVAVVAQSAKNSFFLVEEAAFEEWAVVQVEHEGHHDQCSIEESF